MEQLDDGQVAVVGGDVDGRPLVVVGLVQSGAVIKEVAERQKNTNFTKLSNILLGILTRVFENLGIKNGGFDVAKIFLKNNYGF